MTVLRTKVRPVLRTLTSGMATRRPVQIPMSLQSAFGWHGYDMHPQELVRLSGCQESPVEKRDVTDIN